MLRISLVQTTLHWENPGANRDMLAEKIHDLHGKTDLVILPEMFSTGFTMNAAAMAEPMDGLTMQWLVEQASKIQAGIAGSFICRENDRYFNRFVFMRPDGTFACYDKKHLFSLAGEQEYFTAGRKRVVIDWLGWRICPQICYDLRFPAWGRNVGNTEESSKKDAYDLLLYVANWPARRALHWKKLLSARAIENQSYVAGVNIVGTDGNGLTYSGDSTGVDFGGQILAHSGEGQEAIMTIALEKDALDLYRTQLPFLQDADVFEFKD